MAEKLTALIVTKDHKSLIGGCILSVRRIADELLVVDTGATDGTIELARELCAGHCECTVVQKEYSTAGAVKNWAISQARHNWVVILDVDERLTEELAIEIERQLQTGPGCDGFEITRHDHFLGRRIRFGGWNRKRLIRVFRRDLFQYPDGAADHTEFETKGRTIRRLRYPMNHYTRRSYDEQIIKSNRYTALQAERWHREGRRASFLQMMFRPPLRFLRSYIAYGGFLDGIAGLQIAYLAMYYAFLKQARLWEQIHAVEIEIDEHLDEHLDKPAAEQQSEQQEAA